MPTAAKAAPWIRSSALVLVLLAGGCTQEDPTEIAIQRASAALANLTGGGRVIAPQPGAREKSFKEIVSTLQAHAKDPDPGQAAAVNALSARAKAGLAELKSSPALDLEGRSLGAMSQVRSSLEVWLVQNARAAAADSYNPAPELASLEGIAADLKAKAADAQARKAKLEAEVASLRQQSAQVLAQGRQKREEAARISAEASAMSATSGLPLVERATAVGREADKLDVAVGELEAQIASKQPSIDQLQRDLTSLASQSEQTTRAEQAVKDRAQNTKQQAAEARAAAAAAGQAIARQVEELAAARSGELVTLSDQAASGYRDAISAARESGTKAGNNPKARTSSNLATGMYQQALGETLAARARGLTAHADLLAALAAAKPALPKQAEYAAEAVKLREEAAAKIDEAKQALTDAHSSFDAAGDKEKLKSLIERLERLAGVQKPAEEAAAAPTEAAAAPAAAPVTDDPTAGPRQAITAIIEASKASDGERLFALMHAGSPEAAKVLEATKPLLLAQADLDKACREKLGKGLNQIMMAASGGAGPGMGFDPASYENLTAADFQIEMVGADKATATNPASPEPLTLVKVGDTWKLDADVQPEMAAALPMMQPMLAPLISGMQAAAAGLRDGSITTEEQLKAALMKAMGGMGGGG